MKEFQFYDYIIMISPTGHRASNLREFIGIIEECEDNVLFHHMFQSQLKYHSKILDYNCDFANWASNALEDFALAEKIGNFNPYDYRTISEAKSQLLELIEAHMWDLPNIPWARPGLEFYFSYATSIIIPSGIKVTGLESFTHYLREINNNSLYYHFCESRKIKKEKEHDEFSLWIEENFNEGGIVEKIRAIDFYFYSLDENRNKILKIINQKLKQD
ncbi:MAG: hypothetical protein JW997_04555 [Actinobacteria bacterium]|nr:hypothetical protein [Actinomycetota bacterium]